MVTVQNPLQSVLRNSTSGKINNRGLFQDKNQGQPGFRSSKQLIILKRKYIFLLLLCTSKYD